MPFSFSRGGLVINSSIIASGTPGQFLKVNSDGTLGNAYPPAQSGAQNLKGTFNNTNNDLTIDADTITVVNSTGNAILIVNPGAALVCDIDTAGPIINGRDQAAAFAAGNEVHFYWIYDGATLATIASLTAPPTGPTMPSGYTYFAYIGTQKLNGLAKVLSAELRGNTLTLNNGAGGISVSIGTAGSEQTINLRQNGGVPVIAQQVKAILDQMAITATGAGAALASWQFRHISGVNYCTVAGNYTNSPSTTEYFLKTCEIQMPNSTNGNWYYLLTNSSGTGTAVLNIAGFTVPNNAS